MRRARQSRPTSFRFPPSPLALRRKCRCSRVVRQASPWKKTAVFSPDDRCWLGNSRYAKAPRSCLVRTSRGFGAHHLSLWCAPFDAVVRTKIADDAHQNSQDPATKPDNVREKANGPPFSASYLKLLRQFARCNAFWRHLDPMKGVIYGAISSKGVPCTKYASHFQTESPCRLFLST